MDIKFQLEQTSDMNIPLTYSIMGLYDINNFVKYFQTISGNRLNNSVFLICFQLLEQLSKGHFNFDNSLLISYKKNSLFKIFSITPIKDIT